MNLAPLSPRIKKLTKAIYLHKKELNAVGIKKKKALSPKELIQRQSAALNTGRNSEIIRRLSNCHTCLLKNTCDKHREFNAEQRNKGCQDVRSLYYQNLKKYAQPELLLMKTLAELETQIQIAELLDNQEGNICSAERFRLLNLKEKFLEKVFKYGKGTKTTHVHKFDDDEMIDYSEIDGNEG